MCFCGSVLQISQTQGQNERGVIRISKKWRALLAGCKSSTDTRQFSEHQAIQIHTRTNQIRTPLCLYHLFFPPTTMDPNQAQALQQLQMQQQQLQALMQQRTPSAHQQHVQHQHQPQGMQQQQQHHQQVQQHMSQPPTPDTSSQMAQQAAANQSLKSMPIRAYLDQTVVPLLLEGMLVMVLIVQDSRVLLSFQ